MDDWADRSLDTQRRVELYLLENPRRSTNEIAASMELSASTVRRYLRVFRGFDWLRKETFWWSREQYHYRYWLEKPSG